MVLDFSLGFPPRRFPARQVRVESVLTVLAVSISCSGLSAASMCAYLGGFVAKGAGLLGHYR